MRSGIDRPTRSRTPISPDRCVLGKPSSEFLGRHDSVSDIEVVLVSRKLAEVLRACNDFEGGVIGGLEVPVEVINASLVLAVVAAEFLPRVWLGAGEGCAAAEHKLI